MGIISEMLSYPFMVRALIGGLLVSLCASLLGVSLAAAAIDEESGRKMEVYTDLPGVQFYTGNFLDGQVPGKGGVKYARRQGYCFETQYYPNAVNMPGFASPIVKKGEKYDTTTSYKFMTV